MAARSGLELLLLDHVWLNYVPHDTLSDLLTPLHHYPASFTVFSCLLLDHVVIFMSVCSAVIVFKMIFLMVL